MAAFSDLHNICLLILEFSNVCQVACLKFDGMTNFGRLFHMIIHLPGQRNLIYAN